MFFRNCLGNGKSKTIMISLASSCFIKTVESFKQSRLLFRRYFLASVFHGKNSVMPMPAEREPDLLASVRMPDGVVQKDRNKLR